MSLSAGTRLGSYRIQCLLGAGGMGEVYRATDTTLNRDVALKVLSESFAGSPEFLARFRREAQMLAALSHPNIAHLYGIEQSNGALALVLELVDGPTLADRIAAGPLAIPEAIAIATQIGHALTAAHDKHIVHRDLKPANIKLSADGSVKVLDFGLAKATDAGGVDATAALTMIDAQTRTGMVLGTPAYMSPEQARGLEIDKRTDVWAFGCVLYEMFTGVRAFSGTNASDIIAAVLTSEPAWAQLPASVPSGVQLLMRRCLEKDVNRRLRDIHDIVVALQDAAGGEPLVRAAETRPAGLRRWQIAALAALAGSAATLAIALGLLGRPGRPGEPPVTRLMVTPDPSEEMTISGNERDFALSPDGRHLAYVGGNGAAIFVRDLQSGRAVRIGDVGLPHDLFFSPDGEWVGFMDATTALKKASVRGVVQTICRITSPGVRGAWMSDDTIVFNQVGGLAGVSSSGGTPKALAQPDAASGELIFTSPEAIPHTSVVLVTDSQTQISEGKTVAIDLKTNRHTVVIPDGVQARYLPSGHLIYRTGSQIRMIAFDALTLRTSGEFSVVSEPIFVTPFGGVLNVDGSATGTLAYIANATRGAARQLVWVDRNGRETPIDAPVRAYTYPALSPDSNEVALDIRDQENDIWVWRFATKTLRRFTFGQVIQQNPVWAQNGRRIIFTELASRVQWQSADGSGTPAMLSTTAIPKYPNTVTRDGGALVLRQNDPNTGHDLYLLNLSDGQTPQPLLATSANELNADISPDGRWMAYESDESGRYEVYVRPFPDVTSSRWQISQGGGRLPLWAKDGTELYYVTYDSAVMAAPIDKNTAFASRTPVELFRAPYYFGGAVSLGRTYDVDAKGRFLMIKREPGPPASIMIVLNWQRGTAVVR